MKASIPAFPWYEGEDGKRRYCSLERVLCEGDAEALNKVINAYARRARAHPNAYEGCARIANELANLGYAHIPGFRFTDERDARGGSR